MRRPAAVLSLALVLFAATQLPSGAAFTRETQFGTYRPDDWEPAIAADGAGHVYWATTSYGGPKACKRCPDPAIAYRVSSDGGTTWSGRRFVCACPGVDGQHDPVLATDAQGRVYVTWMNDFEVNFARSDDFGQTWIHGGPIDAVRRFSDKPWIGVSGDGDDVYVTFNADGKNPGAPYTVSSHNGGETWANPVPIGPTTRYWFASGLTVTPDGTVFSAQAAYPQNYEGAISLHVLRSTDGGASWSRIGIERSREQRPCPKFAMCESAFLGPQMAIASDDDGRVYVLYNSLDRKAGPARLYLRRSDDNGETWTLPRSVGRGVRVDHEFPMMVAAGSGDVRIGWMDDNTGRWNTYYRRSVDGGVTFSPPESLSNRATGAPYKSPRGFRFPYGDYGQMAIDGAGTTHATWGEGPSNLGPGGTWYARGS